MRFIIFVLGWCYLIERFNVNTESLNFIITTVLLMVYAVFFDTIKKS